jgi:hypothetical protein
VLDEPGHVVHGTAVEVPSLVLVIIGTIAKESLRAQLVDVEQGRRGERQRGVGVR